MNCMYDDEKVFEDDVNSQPFFQINPPSGRSLLMRLVQKTAVQNFQSSRKVFMII